MSEPKRYLVVDAEAAEAAWMIVRRFSSPDSVQRGAAGKIIRALTPAPEGEAREYAEWWTDPRAIEAATAHIDKYRDDDGDELANGVLLAAARALGLVKP